MHTKTHLLVMTANLSSVLISVDCFNDESDDAVPAASLGLRGPACRSVRWTSQRSVCEGVAVGELN